MKATELIRSNIEGVKDWTLGLFEDVKEDPFIQPTAAGGNHPLWLLGHITFSEASLLDQYLHGEPNRYAKWEDIFAGGTTPTTDDARYPAFDEVLEAFHKVRADTLAYLDTLTDDDLDKPCRQVEGPGPNFETVADSLSAIASHMMFHAGQVADARRAAGRQPLFL